MQQKRVIIPDNPPQIERDLTFGGNTVDIQSIQIAFTQLWNKYNDLLNYVNRMKSDNNLN